MQPADSRLLAQFKAGDARAFRTLVEHYTTPIYRAALRLTGDSMEAENIAQETFLRVVTSLERIQLDLPLQPYLFRIAINLCYDRARKKRPVPFSRFENGANGESAIEAIPDDAPAPWEHLERAALAREVHTAVERLPAPYKAAILLRYFDDLSYEEIAATLEIPVNTVRTHLHRAKQQLCQTLSKQERPVPQNASTPPVFRRGWQTAEGS